MPYLLDSNIVIAIFAGEQSVLDEVSRAEQSSKVRVPTVVLGELYYGALKSAKPTENSHRVMALETRAVIVGCDAHTAHMYGTIKDALRTKGRPVPDNDIWIAALAMQHNLDLVSRDAHFNEVAGLRITTW